MATLQPSGSLFILDERLTICTSSPLRLQRGCSRWPFTGFASWYRVLFRQEIADTVADPADAESELGFLAACSRGGRGRRLLGIERSTPKANPTPKANLLPSSGNGPSIAPLGFVGPDLGDMIADNLIDPRKLLSLGDSAAEKSIL